MCNVLIQRNADQNLFYKLLFAQAIINVSPFHVMQLFSSFLDYVSHMKYECFILVPTPVILVTQMIQLQSHHVTREDMKT